jgi:hypothetical protein
MQRHNYSSRQSRGKLPLWTIFLPLLALTALIAAPPQSRLYLTLFSAGSYSALQCLLPECRFRRDRYLCPLNLAMLLFLLKLVAVPMILMVTQPEQGSLPLMPGRMAMEWALLVETAAYVAFCMALRFVSTRARAAGFWGSTTSLLEGAPGLLVPAAFACLGAIGLFAAFGSIGNLVAYFANPSVLSDLTQEAEGSLKALAGTVLRPFLAFSLILLWCRRIDLCNARGEKSRQALATGAVAIGVVVANLTFSFNRGAFVFPLLALVGVYVSKVYRISPLILAGLAAIVMIPVLSIGSYRASSKPGAEVFSPKASARDVSEEIQIYLAGPQFLGFFLDETGWGRSMYWGRTLVASALDPVPVIGKSFREGSAVAIYNRAIYGDTGNLDQNVPFQGELFINFHLAGVVAGYFALGLLIGELQRRFEAAGAAFAAFAVQYIAAWAAMLIVWSLAVFSQILVYFCWPIYCYAGWNWVKRWSRNQDNQPLKSSLPTSFARGPAGGLP